MTYKIEEAASPLSEERLNELAAEGWELCEVVKYHPYSQTNRAWFNYIFEKDDDE